MEYDESMLNALEHQLLGENAAAKKVIDGNAPKLAAIELIRGEIRKRKPAEAETMAAEAGEAEEPKRVVFSHPTVRVAPRPPVPRTSNGVSLMAAIREAMKNAGSEFLTPKAIGERILAAGYDASQHPNFAQSVASNVWRLNDAGKCDTKQGEHGQLYRWKMESGNANE